ncbi:MAG: hypothetical protein WCJ75_17520, partial [Desulfomonile sp.]
MQVCFSVIRAAVFSVRGNQLACPWRCWPGQPLPNGINENGYAASGGDPNKRWARLAGSCGV